MQESLLVEKHGTLFHMAEPGTWESIKANGLLSTRALLDRLGIEGPERQAILSQHRPHSVQVRGFLIRDQRPMAPGKLAECLRGSGVSPRQWLELLNGKVFFWTCPKRLAKFRAAYSFRRQLIIEVPTSDLLVHHADRVTLCHINSGATRMPDHKRSFESFQTIEDFPYSSKWKPAELTVEGLVQDISEIASMVYEVGEANEREIVFSRA
jgi:hypothetical protein